ncbi:MAG: alpha-amylase family glycosyl hydrolase [bacterium]
MAFALAAAGLPVSAMAQASPPAWTRGATCYEVFVRSFKDSDGDGVGDLKGLTDKLDYINDGTSSLRTSLGARCIWLMPVAESPSYHGYDVSDYYRVNRQYGTNDDFKRLMTAAHKRGIRVLVDMVLNHSSSRHPNFLAALRDTASPYRAWYRWSPTKPAELNPWGQSNWRKSPVRDEWYYAFFDSGMPDLNYRTPAVVAEAKKIARFWLKEMGADGFRLDAVPYLVEEANNNTVHTASTHALLRDYARYVRSVAPNAYTIGEVSDSTRALLTYYPDQLDAYFAFEVADSLIAGVRRGDARGILPAVLRLQDAVPPGRLVPFLRNHDQPRSRTELGGDMAKSRVAAFLLLTMPGVPFVYYGEEIGMTATKPDERLRTPMQWSAGRGAGFTRGTPWERLQDDSLSITVEAQDHDTSSLLNVNRRLIHLRATTNALARGVLVPLTTSQPAVAAYLRRDRGDVALVIVNLGSSPLDDVALSSAAGAVRGVRLTARNLLGGADAASLRPARDGRIDTYVPLHTLAPMQGYIFALSPSSSPTH